MERKSHLVRGGRRVAPRLRADMEALGVSAKELSMLIKAWARQDPANREAIDFRTIQNAMAGSCGLETYFALSGYFGWEFAEEILTPVIGADPITAREAELERHQAQVASIHARLERERTARSAASRVGRRPSLQALQGGGLGGAGPAPAGEGAR